MQVFLVANDISKVISGEFYFDYVKLNVCVRKMHAS